VVKEMKDKQKELLVCLVIGFINTIQHLDMESDNPQNDTNDELNRMGLAIESLSKELGFPIRMDFGMITWMASETKDTVIKMIEEEL
jgi:DNA polymerase elongation subunit (family B)